MKKSPKNILTYNLLTYLTCIILRISERKKYILEIALLLLFDLWFKLADDERYCSK